MADIGTVFPLICPLKMQQKHYYVLCVATWVGSILYWSVIALSNEGPALQSNEDPALQSNVGLQLDVYRWCMYEV